ncbi:Ant antirepressor protein from prophage [Escherichia coli]|uniref:Ant antirepressor protein from prophage n=3 Tax=Escherichia coli TaxID=562 RepID=A0A376D7Z4_ECOLX|nr:Ant antirepressor protein from prophage [Escherichia coli]
MATQISVETLSPIAYNQIPVITTELLAQLYGTETVNIKMNFSRNSARFVQGKHFFKLEGNELREFKHRLSLSESVSREVTESYSVKIARNVRSLILLDRNEAQPRHAKMLETDQAWEVFEKLEDCYFSQCEKNTGKQEKKLNGLSAKEQTALYGYGIMPTAHRHCFRELYPALKLIQSGYSGICHDYGYEFSYTIGRARGVLINHTRDIDIYEPDGPTNLLAWERLKNKELPPSLHRY